MVLAAAQEPVLRGVPKGAPNVLLVGDVMPRVEALLRSPVVRELCAAAEEITQSTLGMKLDPATLERQLGLVRPFVPQRIEVAFDEGPVTVFAQCLHLISVQTLAEMRRDAGDDELVPLREEAAAMLREIREPNGVIRVTMRDERTAEQVYDQVLGLLESMPPDDGVTVDTTGDAIRVTARPLALQRGMLARRLARIGIEVPPAERLTFRLALEQQGKVLALRCGSFEASDVAAAGLGELWRAADTQLFYGRMACADALELGFATYEMLGEAEETFESPLLTQMFSAVDRLTDLSPHNEFALDLDGGMRWTVLADEEEGTEPFEIDRPDPEILRCVDPELGPFGVTALPLDFVLSALGDEIWSRAMQRADAPSGEQMLAALQRFGAFFEYIDGEDSAVFAPGSLFVTAGASWRSLTLPGPGGAPRKVLTKLPFAGMAVVARAESAEAAHEFVDTMVELLCEGAGASSVDAVVEADLGLGVPTRRVDFRRWLPAGVAIDADLDPHHAQVGDVMIFSTDPRLTKRLVERLGAQEAPQLPVDNPISWTLWTGDHWAALVDGLGAWLRGVAEADGGAGRELSMVSQVVSALATLGKAIGKIESLDQFERDGRRLRSTTTVTFR